MHEGAGANHPTGKNDHAVGPAAAMRPKLIMTLYKSSILPLASGAGVDAGDGTGVPGVPINGVEDCGAEVDGGSYLDVGVTCVVAGGSG